MQALDEQPSDADMAYLVPRYSRSYTIRYLYQGASPIHIINMNAPNLAQEVESALAAMEDGSTVKVVEWKAGVDGVGSDTGRFAFLLNN